LLQQLLLVTASTNQFKKSSSGRSAVKSRGRRGILEDYRIKISVLWLFTAVAFCADGVLQLMHPGTIASLMAGQLLGFQVGPALLLYFAVVALVPLVMAFLSLTLKASVNRWANVIVGVVFAILWLFDLGLSIEQLYAAAVLMKLAAVVALAVLVWYAWKS
jgi:hypothetical protein